MENFQFCFTAPEHTRAASCRQRTEMRQCTVCKEWEEGGMALIPPATTSSQRCPWNPRQTLSLLSMLERGGHAVFYITPFALQITGKSAMKLLCIWQRNPGAKINCERIPRCTGQMISCLGFHQHLANLRTSRKHGLG